MKKTGRVLHFDGLYNVRDLGGLAAFSGKKTRAGCFYRSADLGTPANKDLASLATLGLKTVVDFRAKEERSALPDILPAGIARVNLPIDTADMGGLMSSANTGDALRFMESIYPLMVTGAQTQFRAFFALVSDSRNTPLLFHCSAGKDRTGFCSALLLAALGVSRADIFADYLMSAEGLGDKYALWIGEHPALAAVMGVNASYLEAAYDALEDYGGIDTYVSGVLGADVETLRKLYTE